MFSHEISGTAQENKGCVSSERFPPSAPDGSKTSLDLKPSGGALYSEFLSFTHLAATLQIQRLKPVIYKVCFILDTTKAGLEHAKLLL